MKAPGATFLVVVLLSGETLLPHLARAFSSAGASGCIRSALKNRRKTRSRAVPEKVSAVSVSVSDAAAGQNVKDRPLLKMFGRGIRKR